MRGRIVFVLFLATQLSDGLLTYYGIARFGTAVEANPLVSWYILAFGPGAAIVGAKALAASCGAALHLQAMHGTIAVLTILYVAAAVLPWIHVL